MESLLTREQFREAVFTRDGHRCVICGAIGDGSLSSPKLDAHHIIPSRKASS